MDKNILDVAELTTVGFKPLIFCNDWRVATLCYTPDLYPPHIGYVERHMETDEVFVLMKGQVTLFIGGNEKTVDRFEIVPMQPLKTYNVRQGVWHNVIMSKDAVILLVENGDTAESNSEYFRLSDHQKQVFLTEASDYPDWQTY